MIAARSFSAARYVWLVAAAVVMTAAFFGGRALGSDDAGSSYSYELDSPPYAAASTGAASSKGGFSGFGASSGINGETVVSGRVRSVSTEAITLETAGGGTEVVRITGPGTLRRIESAPAVALRPGMSVVVRTASTGVDTASAVLVLAEP